MKLFELSRYIDLKQFNQIELVVGSVNLEGMHQDSAVDTPDEHLELVSISQVDATDEQNVDGLRNFSVNSSNVAEDGGTSMAPASASPKILSRKSRCFRYSVRALISTAITGLSTFALFKLSQIN